MSLHFSDDHEYARIENGVATIGISNYAQNALGDVVYVELPKIGMALKKGGNAGVVEFVKSASEIYAPLSGDVIEINKALEGEPVLVNQDPMGRGWFFKIKVTNAGEASSLKDEAAYSAYIKGL